MIDIQCGGFFPAALARADQERALQLLIFLLPPCNSDTLQRLLRMLSTVAAHADGSVDCDGQKVGNEGPVAQSFTQIVVWQWEISLYFLIIFKIVSKKV